MSHRPTDAKKIRRLRKLLRVTPPRYINLVDWLQTRGHAQTAGGARKLLIEGKVTKGSHSIGRMAVPIVDAEGDSEEVFLPAPIVPADWRSEILVVA